MLSREMTEMPASSLADLTKKKNNQGELVTLGLVPVVFAKILQRKRAEVGKVTHKS